ncbi:hypothetical protein [Aureimonas sp. SK2]|uniref:hypothetical protein n=1 Tax=Aureimonas sp. SK2 TaxID=3015992 RepID=UPI0024449F5B|nr:hypothetical protein [Aureimonas sp. SK2]
MNRLEFSPSFARLLAGLVACILVAALSTPFYWGLPGAAGENGPLEWTQEALLLVAVVFSGAAAAALRGAERMAAFFATLLYLVFLFRELELPEIGPVTTYLGSEAFRWHEALVLAALVLPYALLRRRHGRALIAYGLSFKGWPFALAALCVGIGALFDGAPSLAGVLHLGTFLEETAELVAYAILAAAAGWVLAGVHGGEAVDGVSRDPLGCGAARS